MTRHQLYRQRDRYETQSDSILRMLAETRNAKDRGTLQAMLSAATERLVKTETALLTRA